MLNSVVPVALAASLRKTRWLSLSFLFVVISLANGFFVTSPALATHFRFGNVTWTARPDISPTTVDFTVKAAFRRCGYAGTASDGCPTG